MSWLFGHIETSKDTKPVRYRPCILCGFGKAHKETRSTENEYTITDSFHFAEEICKQDLNLYMASLDTNIPLDETIDICI